MPELPEVEAIAQTIRPFLSGRTIERCRVIHPVVVHSNGRLERNVCGRKIVSVERRGKYLQILLDRGCLALHFRFDGQLLWFDTKKLSGHVDVAFDMPHGTLGFVDQRHLARVQWAESLDHIPSIQTLGVEPLSKQFTVPRLYELLQKSRQPLKLFLLDQTRIAGIGNIYSNEAMWHARLSPRRSANRLTRTEVVRLHKAIVDILRRALECCLHPAPDFRDPAWWFQGLEKMLTVYGREGEKCRSCSAPVRRIPQGGRSTYLCVRCQK